MGTPVLAPTAAGLGAELRARAEGLRLGDAPHRRGLVAVKPCWAPLGSLSWSPCFCPCTSSQIPSPRPQQVPCPGSHHLIPGRHLLPVPILLPPARALSRSYHPIPVPIICPCPRQHIPVPVTLSWSHHPSPDPSRCLVPAPCPLSQSPFLSTGPAQHPNALQRPMISIEGRFVGPFWEGDSRCQPGAPHPWQCRWHWVASAAECAVQRGRQCVSGESQDFHSRGMDQEQGTKAGGALGWSTRGNIT